MSVKVQWSGLDEFLRDMKALPEHLRAEGMEIIREETEGAAVEMAQGFVGKLARSVKTQYPSATILVGIAKTTRPESHLYDRGTKLRKTMHGASRGTMPAARVVGPIARRRRARMARRMVELLKREGFEIGNA